MSSTGRAVDLSASEGLQGIEAELNRVIGSLEIASNRGLLTPRETSRRASVTFLGQSSHAKRLSAAAYAKAIYELGLSVSRVDLSGRIVR